MMDKSKSALKKLIPVLCILIAVIVVWNGYILVVYGGKKAMQQREVAIKYLEDRYNTKFIVDNKRICVRDYFKPSLYFWNATDYKGDYDSFRIVRSIDGEFNDYYQPALYKNDITKYYTNIIDSIWSNAKTHIRVSENIDDGSFIADDYMDFLSHACGIDLIIYLNYDDGFDYEKEAEKIYNFLKEESAYSRDMSLFVYYMDGEKFNSLSIDQLYELENYDSKTYYNEDLRTRLVDDFDKIVYKPLDDLSVQAIIEQLKSKTEIINNQNN